MIRSSWIILSASLLFLSACVPAKGTSSITAFNLITEYEEIEVIAEDKWWYVSRNWSPKTLSVELPGLRNFFDTFRGQTIRTSLSGFTAWQDDLPENWTFKLHEVTGIQKITNANQIADRVDVTWDESVVTTFALHIPKGTKAGCYNGSIVLRKEDNMQVIPVRIKVEVGHGK
jgi:hypothetical protein